MAATLFSATCLPRRLSWRVSILILSCKRFANSYWNPLLCGILRRKFFDFAPCYSYQPHCNHFLTAHNGVLLIRTLLVWNCCRFFLLLLFNCTCMYVRDVQSFIEHFIFPCIFYLFPIVHWNWNFAQISSRGKSTIIEQPLRETKVKRKDRRRHIKWKVTFVAPCRCFSK